MLSPRLQDTYRFIRDYIAQHNHAPLLSEIALGIGIRSKGVVHRYLQSLISEGLLTIESSKHRGISLTSKKLADNMPPRYRLPLLGRIAAGQPIEAIPNHDEIDLSEFFIGENRFVLKVQGDSMIEAGILDGDMVVIEKTDHANNNDIVVALIDNESATLKTFRNNHDGSLALIPSNSNMQTMIYSTDRVVIQGIVVGQLRSYR